MFTRCTAWSNLIMRFSMNAYTHALSKGAELSRSIIINLQAGDSTPRQGGAAGRQQTAARPTSHH